MGKGLSLFSVTVFSAVALMGPSDSYASPKGHSQRILRSQLSALEGVATEARGHVHRKSEKKKKLLMHDKLDARVRVPLPSVVPALPDAASAAALQVLAVFSREGADFAQCAFALTGVSTRIEAEEMAQMAHFRLDIELNTHKKKGVILKVKRGSCDTDLAAEGVQQGIPNVKADDSVIISAGGVSFLEGEF